MKSANLSSKGFSLIELMVVVVAIGILAAVAVPAYFNHILRTRQSDAYHNLLDIKSAQEMVYSLSNSYAGNPSANPLTPWALHTYSDTLTNMLSFDVEDTKYFMYYVTSSTGPAAFQAWAEGKHTKLKGGSIEITDTDDPCLNIGTSKLKLSLGLDECP